MIHFYCDLESRSIYGVTFYHKTNLFRLSVPFTLLRECKRNFHSNRWRVLFLTARIIREIVAVHWIATAQKKSHLLACLLNQTHIAELKSGFSPNWASQHQHFECMFFGYFSPIKPIQLWIIMWEKRTCSFVTFFSRKGVNANKPISGLNMLSTV